MKVDPLQKLIPQALREDPEVEGFIRNLLDVVEGLRERTGGATDLIEAGLIQSYQQNRTTCIEQLDGFYRGDGVPDASMGCDGDIYYRKDGTIDVIYHKQSGSWVAVA